MNENSKMQLIGSENDKIDLLKYVEENDYEQIAKVVTFCIYLSCQDKHGDKWF